MPFPARLAVVLALAVCASCVPPLPDNDEYTRFDEETVMGRLQDAGELRVALPDDAGAPWALVEGTSAQGFAPDLAREIGESLRVDVTFREAPSAELVDLVDSGQVDVAFPVATITEELVRRHAFSDPIFVAHQRLLMREGTGVEDVDDISGEVCSPIDDATGVDLLELNPSAATLPLRPGDVRGCIDLLRQGLVDVATATDVLLAGMLVGLSDGYEVTGEQLTTEAYGISLESGASGWVDYVNKIITEYDQEGRWAASYESHFGSLIGGATPEPPNMTVEEAAALFPADLDEE
ncbi:MAG: transporter substrate-binding domain-containing protein [Actinomycetota bacterium]|nr:transporter substrate-binding domain-containing protein [Actinomycetota bacterium]